MCYLPKPCLTLQTTLGSPPVTGTFDLKINGQLVKDIPAEVGADVLEMLLEANLKDEGGFEVSQMSDHCSGNSWQINWETRGGGMDPIGTDVSKLKGVEPVITVTTILDGGTWLRPIGGEMLRLPMTEPQVCLLLQCSVARLGFLNSVSFAPC